MRELAIAVVSTVTGGTLVLLLTHALNRRTKTTDDLAAEVNRRLVSLESKVDDLAETQAGNSAVLGLIFDLVKLHDGGKHR